MNENTYPLVTIITATYNLINTKREQVFRQAVDSVKKQSYKNIEHLIIDGASNDTTLKLIKELNLKYISEVDNGIYDAFNKGIANANGKYILFLNSDDYFCDEDAIKLLVQACEENDADFSFAKFKAIDETGKLIKYKKIKLYNCFSQMPFGHLTMLVKKELFQKEGVFDTRYKIVGDYDFTLRLLIKKYKYKMVNKTIAAFRNTGVSSIDEITLYTERFKLFKNTYQKYIKGDGKKIYKDILTQESLPFSLLFALGARNPLFYIINFKNKLKNCIKFKFKGFKLEYLCLFWHYFIPRKKVEQLYKIVEENYDK